MAKTLKKSAFPIAAVLLIVAGLIYAFWPRPIPVSLITVERGPMMVTIEDEGETRVKEVYTISSPLSGRVARFEGHAGLLPLGPALQEDQNQTDEAETQGIGQELGGVSLGLQGEEPGDS